MIRVIFFDLFFTLVVPSYDRPVNENDVLGLSVKEWESYAEDSSLYAERASGLICDEAEIIRRITDTIPMEVSAEQNAGILKLRRERMKDALLNVDGDILKTLNALREAGLRLCLISNADAIDKKYWPESALYPYFDEAVFSCDVGFLKPDREIYEAAMDRMGVSPEDCLFVGDGGSDELSGASRAGIRTVRTEALTQHDGESRKALQETADHHIRAFKELLEIAGCGK